MLTDARQHPKPFPKPVGFRSRDHHHHTMYHSFIAWACCWQPDTIALPSFVSSRSGRTSLDNGHESNIGMTRTLLCTISNELVPDILQLFNQLGGADLIHNICNHHTSPMTHSSGGLTASPSSSSSSGLSPTHHQPCQHWSSISTIYHVPLSRHTWNIPLTPAPAGSLMNPIDVESYHASAFSSEVDAERSFGIDPYLLACSMEMVKEESPPHSPIDLGPLSQDHPRYHEACFKCCYLGHIRIHCQWYQCLFCLKGTSGHKQLCCCQHCGHSHTPSIPMIEESLPNYEDYHGIDVSLNPEAKANISGKPLRDWEPVVLIINWG